MENKVIWVLMSIVIMILVLYLIGCIIAMDTNPLHWWLFKSIAGRIVTIFLLLLIVAGAFKEIS
jgi:hypothetical protein